MSSETSLAARPHERRIPWASFLLGSLLALPFAFGLALGNSFSHDEGQHLAAGVLIARDHLHCYRDFPYFHVPYLAYLYGLLFRFTDHYLLVARLVAGLSAALTAGALFAASQVLLSARPRGQRLALGVIALGLMLTAPLFYATVGHAWNQELSLLLAFAGFLCELAALERERPRWLLALAGLLLGLSIGVRITFAPLIAPFGLMLLLDRRPIRERLLASLVFSLGLGLGLLPVIIAAATAPAGFVFGNVEFPKVNIIYRMATGEPRTMTLAKKLRFVFKLILRPNWILCYGLLAAWLAARPAVRAWPRGLWFLLLTLPFLLFGSIAPSPLFDQYFYPFAPFLALGFLFVISAIRLDSSRFTWIASAAACLILLGAWTSHRKYGNVRDLLRPAKWSATVFHLEATELRRLVPSGRILTLGPALPLEAGLQIYPELSTGPFAWRVAPFVSAARRPALRLLAPEDIAARLKDDPPAAILLDIEKAGEEPLLTYAQAHGYHAVPFSGRGALWLAP